jgi:hypothetical protein
MRFAPVAPLHIHRKLADQGVLGDYHLLIASEVLKDPKGHRDFWQSRKNQFIIMDNGLIELGYSLPGSSIYEAARIVGASVIVLPDTIGDKDKTLEESAAAKHVIEQETNDDLNFLGVVQGKDFDEAVLCATELANHIGVRMLSVPRHFGDSLGSRQELVVQIRHETQLPIHLLGFSEHMVDDFRSAVLEGVTGIDSAVPIWLGLDPRREYFPNYIPIRANYGRRPENYWTMDTEDMFVINANVLKVQNWLNAARGAPTVALPSVPGVTLTHR